MKFVIWNINLRFFFRLQEKKDKGIKRIKNKKMECEEEVRAIFGLIKGYILLYFYIQYYCFNVVNTFKGKVEGDVKEDKGKIKLR